MPAQHLQTSCLGHGLHLQVPQQHAPSSADADSQGLSVQSRFDEYSAVCAHRTVT